MTDPADNAFEEGFTGKISAPPPRPAAPAADEPENLEPVKARIAEKYPALRPYVVEARLQWGDKANNKGGGALEFFPQWELNNPNPGAITIEVYDRKLKGKWLEDAIAGEMLHQLSSVDPRTNEPVDRTWRDMRDKLMAARDSGSIAIDNQAYAGAVARGEARTFDQWMDDSRADAHVRGYITPDERNEWRNAYTPLQREVLEEMKRYLGTEPGRGLINRSGAP